MTREADPECFTTLCKAKTPLWGRGRIGLSFLPLCYNESRGTGRPDSDEKDGEGNVERLSIRMKGQFGLIQVKGLVSTGKSRNEENTPYGERDEISR